MTNVAKYTLYDDLSHRVMSVLADVGLPQEVYSIDDCFLDVTSDGDAAVSMATARARVAHDVGIPTSVGIGVTKTLAKLASDMAKNRPDGVLVLPGPGQYLASLLGVVPVNDVWGIGPRIGATLISWGVRRALDQPRMNPSRMRAQYGITGERVVQELRGVRCIDLEVAQSKQTITCSRSFGEQVTALDDLRAAVASFVKRACEKARRQHCAACGLTVFVEHNRFDSTALECSGTLTHHLSVPSNLTTELMSHADQMIRVLWSKGERWNIGYEASAWRDIPVGDMS